MTSVPLADQPARDRIAGRDGRGLDETLFVEAGAGTGKTTQLIDRVLALIDSEMELRHIAAITFTEKAALELRDRLRKALEEEVGHHGQDGRRALREQAREQLDGAPIHTLHAFAQRLLTDLPIEAGLPPKVEALDEVASQLAFERRWEAGRDALLDDPELRRTLLLAFALGITLAQLRDLAVAFGDNWDLLADSSPWADAEPPPLDLTGFLTVADAVLARRGECSDGNDKMLLFLDDELEPYLAGLRAEEDELLLLELALECPNLRHQRRGRKPSWRDIESVRSALEAAADQLEAACDGLIQAVLERLACRIRAFTLAAAGERRDAGELEFHDLLVLARALLRSPEHGAAARRRLRDRYRSLLLDEFQDTDPIQIEIATLLASGGDHEVEGWADMPTDPGRLFFVGDPKQSIYRFRRADIGLFLRARQVFGPEPVQLRTSFRSTPTLLEWVNHVFGQLITAVEGSQPAYQPLEAAPDLEPAAVGPTVGVLGVAAHEDRPNAEALREREAADVARTVVTAVAEGWQVRDPSRRGWRAAGLGDITILLPSRTSLPALERALEHAAIPYRAEAASLVYGTREVRDVMACLRAVADPTDQLALTCTLRSALFGCGDDDLVTYRLGHGGAWNYWAPLPESLPENHPVAEGLAFLRGLAEAAPWSTPSELIDRIVRDRGLAETGYVRRRPRDLWRRLRFVTDQARAWSDAAHGTLREYLEWAALQGSDHVRVAETILPETDDDSVRIMTVHAAKGLEFPVTILSGTTTRPRGQRDSVQVLWGHDPIQLRLGKDVTTPNWEAAKAVDEAMDFHERLRLLYVAATRARDHLVVSLHRKQEAAGADDRKASNGELLAAACADAPVQEELDLEGHDRLRTQAGPVPAPLPPVGEWRTEIEAVLDRARHRHTRSATNLGDLFDEQEGASAETESIDEELEEGGQKNPRDLELPPWLKGRYGSAIGRAVHGVLQVVNLATGEGLDEAVAAQAAAEGVLGREEPIRALARAALDSPIVQEAARGAHWRETYVAAEVDGRLLEGYIDLLYRSDEGLVVVDYKVTSGAADLESWVERYRPQAAAYARATRAALGQPAAAVVLLFLTSRGALPVRALPRGDNAPQRVARGVPKTSWKGPTKP